MNTRELDLAYKVRHALNESAEQLPPAVTERLAAARGMALAQRKKEVGLHALVSSHKIAGHAGGFFSSPIAWLGRMGLLLPLLMLLAFLASLYQVEQERHIVHTAEMDAAVLADELPLSAYLDHGFNAYLAALRDD